MSQKKNEMGECDDHSVGSGPLHLSQREQLSTYIIRGRVCMYLVYSDSETQSSYETDFCPSQTVAVCTILEDKTDSGGLPDSWCYNL